MLGGCGATRTAVYVCRACTCIHGHMLYLPRVRCPAAATSAVCGVREKYTARFHYLLAAALAHSAGPRFPASRADRSRDYLCIYLCRYASICVDTQSESWANSPTVEGPRHPSPIPPPPPRTHTDTRANARAVSNRGIRTTWGPALVDDGLCIYRGAASSTPYTCIHIYRDIICTYVQYVPQTLWGLGTRIDEIWICAHACIYLCGLSDGRVCGRGSRFGRGCVRAGRRG